MLKSVIICTAIATFAIIPQAHAQTPFPGYGPLYGSGAIQGGRDYSDWQQTRRDHGLDYDQDAIQRHDQGYQPYSSVTPRISDPYNDDDYYRPRNYSDPYGR
jgi:hypothetical protein